MKKRLCILLLGASLMAASAFADQGQAGWACYTKNQNTGAGGRWFGNSQAQTAREAVNVCQAGGRYSCILVKCVPAGSPQDRP